MSPLARPLSCTLILAVPILLAGCGGSVPPPATRIDKSKIIDLHDHKPLSIRVTIFAYRDADARGWPAADGCQRYVRFLQDRDIPVGFMRDPDSSLHYAMIDSGKVDAIRAADKEAAAAGVEKPPMVPDTPARGISLHESPQSSSSARDAR